MIHEVADTLQILNAESRAGNYRFLFCRYEISFNVQIMTAIVFYSCTLLLLHWTCPTRHGEGGSILFFASWRTFVDSLNGGVK
ncbi:TPA: hypothetical protein MHR78_10705 [Klebsiella variicola]|uniref:Uncharacterized protein n=1 Tax=Klebsiella variicola TaxID=244366 RepID=A0A2N5AII8_KLEVA|nr:hypothetical protein B8O08_11060 [Klebsiella variicola]PJX60016.1 hypothetical protein CWM63_08385 [Klebsiella sp. F-Nf9]PKJ62399.1 hypothetical protein CW266_24030 [Klebsiella sp. T11]PKJ67103.1 hypothetical protein CW267_29475 [Klebsiella sp. X1-16S-Nf21]AXO73880.1 hypothetical protein BC497_22225 [Klebsiella variicola]